ncbi:cytochrome c oxidase subunit 1 [Phlyctochytrium planicorne]|nr:cytochrome c oxidase subunit 1 [Phlyctochytrium planicorne]
MDAKRRRKLEAIKAGKAVFEKLHVAGPTGSEGKGQTDKPTVRHPQDASKIEVPKISRLHSQHHKTVSSPKRNTPGVTAGSSGSPGNANLYSPPRALDTPFVIGKVEERNGKNPQNNLPELVKLPEEASGEVNKKELLGLDDVFRNTSQPIADIPHFRDHAFIPPDTGSSEDIFKRHSIVTFDSLSILSHPSRKLTSPQGSALLKPIEQQEAPPPSNPHTVTVLGSVGAVPSGSLSVKCSLIDLNGNGSKESTVDNVRYRDTAVSDFDVKTNYPSQIPGLGGGKKRSSGESRGNAIADADTQSILANVVLQGRKVDTTTVPNVSEAIDLDAQNMGQENSKKRGIFTGVGSRTKPTLRVARGSPRKKHSDADQSSKSTADSLIDVNGLNEADSQPEIVENDEAIEEEAEEEELDTIKNNDRRTPERSDNCRDGIDGGAQARDGIETSSQSGLDSFASMAEVDSILEKYARLWEKRARKLRNQPSPSEQNLEKPEGSAASKSQRASVDENEDSLHQEDVDASGQNLAPGPCNSELNERLVDGSQEPGARVQRTRSVPIYDKEDLSSITLPRSKSVTFPIKHIRIPNTDDEALVDFRPKTIKVKSDADKTKMQDAPSRVMVTIVNSKDGSPARSRSPTRSASSSAGKSLQSKKKSPSSQTRNTIAAEDESKHFRYKDYLVEDEFLEGMKKGAQGERAIDISRCRTAEVEANEGIIRDWWLQPDGYSHELIRAPAHSVISRSHSPMSSLQREIPGTSPRPHHHHSHHHHGTFAGVPEEYHESCDPHNPVVYKEVFDEERKAAKARPVYKQISGTFENILFSKAQAKQGGDDGAIISIQPQDEMLETLEVGLQILGKSMPILQSRFMDNERSFGGWMMAPPKLSIESQLYVHMHSIPGSPLPNSLGGDRQEEFPAYSDDSHFFKNDHGYIGGGGDAFSTSFKQSGPKNDNFVNNIDINGSGWMDSDALYTPSPFDASSFSDQPVADFKLSPGNSRKLPQLVPEEDTTYPVETNKTENLIIPKEKDDSQQTDPGSVEYVETLNDEAQENSNVGVPQEDPVSFYLRRHRSSSQSIGSNLGTPASTRPGSAMLSQSTSIASVSRIDRNMDKTGRVDSNGGKKADNATAGAFIDSNAGPNLYEVIHGTLRRINTLTPGERGKYPTLTDPGPPEESGETENALEPSVEIEKLSQLINSSNLPIPAFLRRRGILYGRIGRYEEALADLSKAIQYDPFNSDALWHRHQLFLRLHNIDAALKDLDAITDSNKLHLGAFQAKARIYQEVIKEERQPGLPLDPNVAGLVKLAVVNYSQVIRLKPDDPDGYYQRACLFELENEMVYANEDFKMVRQLDPSNEHAIHNLAVYSFQRQLWDDAIQAFTKLLKLNAMNGQAFLYRGRAFACLAKWDEALRDLTMAIQLAPDRADVFFHRGCLLRERNRRRAIEDLSISVLLDDGPSNSEAFFQRAVLYYKLKKYDLAIIDYTTGIVYMRYFNEFYKALECFNKAIQHDPIQIRAYLCRGDLFQILHSDFFGEMGEGNVADKRGKKPRQLASMSYIDRAIRDYSKAIHMCPSDHLLYLYRGKLLLKQGRMKESTYDFHAAFELNSSIAQTFVQPKGAIRDLSKALEYNKKEPQIYLQRGICYENLKDWSHAAAEFSRCIAQNPRYAKAYYHRGLCKLHEGNSRGVIDLDRALKYDPKFFEAYLTRASYYHARGAFTEGIEDCNEALKLEPSSIRAHLLRGACKCKLHQYGLAIIDFTKAIQLDKSCHFAFYNRAVTYQLLEDLNNAIKDYSIVLLLHNDSNAYRNRGLIYWKLGDAENALLDLYAARDNFPGDARLHGLLALCLQKVGRIEESLEAFSSAIRVNPYLIEAYLGRGNVYASINNSKAAR